ncbi:MAG: hypothetical protein F8N39_14915 [Clostridiaceae bacterium]|nr:hypothetical protein [Clostridiaceae bacterium]
MLGDYKYELLMKYFESLHGNKVILTYDELEKIIGFKLPKSAYQYNAYWRESKTHTITRSWIENRWKITELKLGKYVEFTRSV